MKKLFLLLMLTACSPKPPKLTAYQCSIDSTSMGPGIVNIEGDFANEQEARTTAEQIMARLVLGGALPNDCSVSCQKQ